MILFLFLGFREIRKGSFDNDLFDNDLFDNDLFDDDLYDNDLFDNDLFDNDLFDNDLFDDDLYEGKLLNLLEYDCNLLPDLVDLFELYFIVFVFVFAEEDNLCVIFLFILLNFCILI